MRGEQQARSAVRGTALLTLAAALGPGPGNLDGQSSPSSVIDTVILDRQNLFADSLAAANSFYDLLNSLHVRTRRYVIERELLLESGAGYDSLLAAESERNLRRLGLFQRVRVDTTRTGGRLAAVVDTRDAWSIQPRIEAKVASDGTLTGSLGATEKNVAGTGSLLRAWYVREADRDGLVLSARMDRVGRSRVGVFGSFLNLSDRTSGVWGVGRAFRSFSDRWSLSYAGEAFDGRVLQYRTLAPADRDTTEWTRRAFTNRAFAAIAPVAGPAGYVRIGMALEVRREEYFPLVPSGSPNPAVPDSVYGQVGLFAELRRTRFERVDFFNGFTDEDVDLSTLAFVQANLASSAWGYRETGIGARGLVGAGARLGPMLAKLRVDANGLWTGSGLDSGRVVGTGTLALQPAPRQVSFLRVTGGVQDAPPPGGEFDLGFERAPRLWPPHAFVGTRSVIATLEHRLYAWDRIFDLIGLGFTGFAEYGGAWYDDQSSRLGGNVGVSIFAGSPLSPTAQVSHLSAGYRFGGGLGGEGGSRWVVSLGSGIVF